MLNSHYLFVIYLDYIKHVRYFIDKYKAWDTLRDKIKMVFRRQKNQNEIYKCAKNRIK